MLKGTSEVFCKSVAYWGSKMFFVHDKEKHDLFLGTNCVGEHWILACSNGWFWGFRMWCFKEGFYLPKHRLSLKGFPTLKHLQQTNQKLQGCINKNPKALLQYLVSRWCLMRLEPDVRANVYNFPPDLRSNQALPQALVRSTSWKRSFFSPVQCCSHRVLFTTSALNVLFVSYWTTKRTLKSLNKNGNGRP